MAKRVNLTGIEIRHRSVCEDRSTRDARCVCKPTFRAIVFDDRTGKPVRSKTYREIESAITWRIQKLAAMSRGERLRHDRTTVGEAGVRLLSGMRAGTILIQDYMGHSTVAVTPGLYGHLLPGAEREFVARMDRYLDADLIGDRGS